MNLQSRLEIEFKKPLKAIGKDFKTEFNNAKKSHDTYDAIREVLLAILNEYANTKPTTKVGRFGRFMSRIGAVLLKVIKFKRNR